jgi:hypothetical protein
MIMPSEDGPSGNRKRDTAWGPKLVIRFETNIYVHMDTEYPTGFLVNESLCSVYVHTTH